MTSDDRHRNMDAARLRAELSVRDLWLRYVALGGGGDVFDLDGYLQGLLQLDAFQQDVLAQCLNESLQDSYRRYCVPLSADPLEEAGDDRLSRLVNDILGDQPPAAHEQAGPPTTGPPDAPSPHSGDL